jgi:Glycosyl hydrolases family 11
MFAGVAIKQKCEVSGERKKRRERIMCKKLKYGLGVLGVISIATATYAAEYKNNAQGVEGSTFYTVYSAPGYSNFASINVTDSKNRGFTLNWDNKNDNRADFASGGGFENVNRPTTISYSVNSWSVERAGNNGMFGVYGWSCPTNAGVKNQDNVEFYIVDAWLDGNVKQFVPFDTTYKTNVKSDGATYNIYQSPTYTRDNACGSGQKFHQVWAVRQGRRFVDSRGVNLGFQTISNVMDDYGYFEYNLRYLVVGVDAFANTKAKISVGYVSKS